MTKLEILDRGIVELRKLLSKCWREMSSGHLTPYDRRELRNQINTATSDLRRCLDAYEAEARRLRELAAQERTGPPSVQLRFLSTDYKLLESAG
jgi:hypothetical protein